MNTYRLVHQPARDVTGYRLPDRIDGPTITFDLVTFQLPEPADEHEASVTVTLTRAAWESQGSPEELLVALSAPIVEGIDGA